DPPASEKERAYSAKNILHFPKGALKNWPNLEDVEIVIRTRHQWLVNILPLASVNEETQIAQTALAGTYRLTPLWVAKKVVNESCWVENVLGALGEPGEWVLNSQEGKLYLWPRDGRPPQGIMAPRLRELIRVEGRIDKEGPEDIPVRNLRFRGLTFMHGERYLLAEDDAGLQHDWDMHDRDYALVRLRGAENCDIEQCHFVHSGGGAIRVDLHGQNNRIVGNHIEHIGGTGILLCGYGPDVNNRNVVYNNIHHVGEIYWHSPGIFVWQSGENRVANNLIHHTPYSGMMVSGCMTHFFARPDDRELVRTIRWHEVGGGPSEKTLEQVRPFLHTHDNLIEYNEIHHAMEKLGDGNGIYVRGAGAGNVIRRNYIHHLITKIAAQSAIRTDGGQRDTLIAENLVYKCVSQGIKLKGNNRLENNVIANLIEPVRAYVGLHEGPMTGATIKRNILYHSSSESCTFIKQDPKGTRGRKPAQVKDIDMDNNLYYCVGKPEEGRQTLAENQRDGVDARSLAADPLFVDPANGDFRLKAGSPAVKLGFIPIDLSKVGLRDTP
ncbi:MAG: right-handed parallel beta-helix repeat-containing protein, partial [Planctomycetota bacterium]